MNAPSAARKQIRRRRLSENAIFGSQDHFRRDGWRLSRTIRSPAAFRVCRQLNAPPTAREIERTGSETSNANPIATPPV